VSPCTQHETSLRIIEFENKVDARGVAEVGMAEIAVYFTRIINFI
jgi:hypothetical protein